MAMTRKQEERALDQDERDLVAQSHHPRLQELDDGALTDLVKRMRERRDRAQTEASRRRREMRGKGEAKGARASTANHGSKDKLEVLATAMRRLNAEHERRRKMKSRLDLAQSARRALALKTAADEKETAPAEAFNTRTARKGMRRNERSRREDLIRPMELGRQRKAGAVAQAKRDAR
jgi:hypothetical protein